MGRGRLRCVCGEESELRVIVPRLVHLIGWPPVKYVCDACWRVRSVKEEREHEELDGNSISSRQDR